MFHKGQELAMYIGDKPFQEAKRGFERPRLPKWKMEKAIYEDIPRRKLKLSDYLHINVENAGMPLMVILFCSTLIHCIMDSVPLAHS